MKWTIKHIQTNKLGHAMSFDVHLKPASLLEDKPSLDFIMHFWTIDLEQIAKKISKFHEAIEKTEDIETVKSIIEEFHWKLKS